MRRYIKKRKAKPNAAITLRRLLRRLGSFAARRYGGGFDVFRGGYAKCIFAAAGGGLERSAQAEKWNVGGWLRESFPPRRRESDAMEEIAPRSKTASERIMAGDQALNCGGFEEKGWPLWFGIPGADRWVVRVVSVG